MSRPRRVDAPGAWQRVLNRSDADRPLFQGASDRARFLELLGQAGERHGVEVHGFALLERHFHLLLRSLRGRLSEAMRQVQQAWSVEVGRRPGARSPLFRARFQSALLGSHEALTAALRDIHEEPVLAGYPAGFADLTVSSLPAYEDPDRAPPWLHTAALRGLLGEDGRVRAPDVVEEAVERQPMPVLEAVRALTGADLSALQQGGRGPAANPARRFAIWALRRHTDLSQAEIAGLLAMSTRQVQNVELRTRRAATEPVAGWIRQWMTLPLAEQGEGFR